MPGLLTHGIYMTKFIWLLIEFHYERCTTDPNIKYINFFVDDISGIGASREGRGGGLGPKMDKLTLVYLTPCGDFEVPGMSE